MNIFVSSNRCCCYWLAVVLVADDDDADEVDDVDVDDELLVRPLTPQLADHQSHPFSLIMCANSMIYLPSLYFWLDSKACSCKGKMVTHLFKKKMQKENLRISIRAVFCSIHSKYRRQHEVLSTGHVLQPDRMPR